MDAIWRAAERAVCFVSRYGAVFLAAIGIGLVRATFGWLLGSHVVQAPGYDWRPLVSVGEIVVFALLTLIVLRRGPLCRRSLPLLAGVAVLVLTLLLEVVAASGRLPAGVVAFGSVCAGASYAALLLLWLEACGCMAPVEAVLAIAGSYVVSLIGWLVFLPLGSGAGSIAAAVLAVTAAALLVVAYFLTPGEALPAVRGRSGIGDRGGRVTVSMRIVAWAASAFFVYGFGGCFIQTGCAPGAPEAGAVLPFAAIAAAFVASGARFDLRMLYRMSLALMGVGVASVLLCGAFQSIPSALMSAAQAGTSIAMCGVGCTAARRRHESAVLGCGVLLAVSLVAELAGDAAGSAFLGAGFAPSEPMARIVVAAAAAALMLLGALLMRDEDLSSLVVEARTPAVLEQDARRAGLSKRESVVFALMADGKSAAQIGDELFMAQDAVREHTSRIYDKLGVCSRDEFSRLLGL